MQIIWQQDTGCLILPLWRSRLKLSFDTKPAAGVNWTGCVRQQWAVCLADYRYAKSTKVVREFWRLPETARSIVHHFPLLFLPSRHATIYTLRESSETSFPPRCGLRLVHRSQHGTIRLADSESEMWALKADRGWKQAADNSLCFLVLRVNAHLEYDSDTKSFSCHILHKMMCIRFSI